MTTHSTPPQADGLYDPRYEHDACGVAMVAKLDNAASHEVVVRALEALDNLEHRGAEGADTRTGDGAGILTQLPDAFLRSVVDFELPPAGRYGVGMCFLPQDPQRRAKIEQLLELNVRVEGQHVLGWRDVPVDLDHVGDTAARSRPYIRQLFVEAGPGTSDDQMAFERKLYVIRRIVELATGPDFYAPSFSSRTLVYKGMLISHQLRRYFPDLQNPAFASAMALVHSRFSTNTFPSWELSHPYRVIAHNGEINTLMGNKNWMRARESQLASELFGRDLNKVIPIVREGGSDSATFDNVLELLMLAGRSLPHAVMMMIPEAYAGRDDLPEHLKGFYAFHSCFMEPWDGPAAVCFTDGRVVGATLDRNGLRPGRWMETHDGYVILGSEAGMLAVPPERVKRLGRLAPGKLFLVDLGEGRIVEDEEVKEQVATAQPYGRWYADHVVHFDDLPEREPTVRAPRPAPRPAAGVRLEPGGPARPARAHGRQGRGAHRLHGQRRRARRAVRPAPRAVHLLQAALRPGDEPADRPDPRGRRHVAGHGRRRGGQPPRRGARPRAADRDGPAHPAQPRARDAAPDRAPAFRAHTIDITWPGPRARAA
jgi:glutamate synthase (NADPH/NADH) large chain/glutamate synthase (ferredoxin)